MSRVLLVADSEWVINDVHAVLGGGDWDVEVLTDPHQTLDTVVATSPDVVLADLQIGSMGGMAVVRDIRAGVEAEDRPRLVLLLDRSADGFLAKRAGADAWVVKPFEADQLRQASTPPSD
jgi:two-component system chemotaxis response regulator CheY